MNSITAVKKSEIATSYSVTPRTVDNWMRAGKIPYFKIGKVVRFNPSKVATALARFEVAS